MSQEPPTLPPGYRAFLEGLKSRIRTARLKAVVAVNRELIQLYWDVGRAIAERQRAQGWGKSVVDRLALDLQRAFPGMAGFSPRNVWYMRSFFLAYAAARTNLQQPVAESGPERPPLPVSALPWGHNIVLLEKLGEGRERLWYARQALEHGWSRGVLVHHIGTGLHERQGKAVTNFKRTLPPPQSDLAEQAVKDPYAFDFLLCRSKNRLVAEYALRDSRRPIGVSAFRLTKALPEGLKGSLPTVGELEAELGARREGPV